MASVAAPLSTPVSTTGVETPVWGRELTAADPQYVYDEEKSQIGEGTYGKVYKCTVKESKLVLKISKPNDMGANYNEATILKKLNHVNVIQVHDYYTVVASPVDVPQHHLVMDLAATDVHYMCKRGVNKLTEDHIQYIMCQIFRGLSYVHNQGFIHQDLSGPNILLDPDCKVRLADFGMAIEAKGEVHNSGREITNLWYRAPELLYRTKTYSSAIDVWSAGCIMAEILSGQSSSNGCTHSVLFNEKDEISQLKLIAKYLGLPTEEMWPDIKKCSLLFYVATSSPKPKPWKSVYPGASDEALDLLNRLLVYDPSKRYTAQQALEHPYFSAYKGRL